LVHTSHCTGTFAAIGFSFDICESIVSSSVNDKFLRAWQYLKVADEGIGLAYIAPQPPGAFEQPLGILRRRLGSVKKRPKKYFLC
jgi:hypothetical protein